MKTKVKCKQILFKVRFIPNLKFWWNLWGFFVMLCFVLFLFCYYFYLHYLYMKNLDLNNSNAKVKNLLKTNWNEFFFSNVDKMNCKLKIKPIKHVCKTSIYSWKVFVDILYISTFLSLFQTKIWKQKHVLFIYSTYPILIGKMN